MKATLVVAGIMSVALVAGAGAALVTLKTQDDVTITQEVIAGDPAYMDGIRFTFCECSEQPFERTDNIWGHKGLTPWQTDPKLMWKAVATFDSQGVTVTDEKCHVDDFTACYQDVFNLQYSGIGNDLLKAMRCVRETEYKYEDQVVVCAVDDYGNKYGDLYTYNDYTVFNRDVVYLWYVESEKHDIPEGLDYYTLYKLTFSDPHNEYEPAHIEKISQIKKVSYSYLRSFLLEYSGDILIEDDKCFDDEGNEIVENKGLDKTIRIYDHETGKLLVDMESDTYTKPYEVSNYLILTVESENGKKEVVVLDESADYREVFRTDCRGELKTVLYDEEKGLFYIMSMLKHNYDYAKLNNKVLFDSVNITVCDENRELYVGNYIMNTSWYGNVFFDTIVVGEFDVDSTGHESPGDNTLEYIGIDYRMEFVEE
ncbi:MAG: hypothetical protein K6F92_03740 [Lachnospiraceae bacterium]|nr:hypothetical protein [Lachnospiraceae bacterium]